MAMPFVSKWPRWAQAELDFLAPEIQLGRDGGLGEGPSKLETIAAGRIGGGSGGGRPVTHAADMFSLGLLVCALFNGGRSLLECNGEAEFYEAALGQVLELYSQILLISKFTPKI